MNKGEFTKKVLDNIHELGIGMKGENQSFNYCMRYIMECMKENSEYDYDFFRAISGDCFTPLYRLDNPRSIDVICLTQDLLDDEIVKRTFDACGYDVLYVKEPELKENNKKYIEMIMEYINRGIPVIARNCGGTYEYSVICGYKDNGTILFFLKGEDKSQTEYSSELKPYKNYIPMELIFIGEKKQAPEPIDAFMQAVMKIPEYLTLPPKNGYVFGKNAFTAWADKINTINDMFWENHCQYSVNAASLACTYGIMLRIERMLPDDKLIKSLVEGYKKMQVQFDKLCANPDAFGKIQSDESKRELTEIINGFAECCDEILEIFRVK